MLLRAKRIIVMAFSSVWRVREVITFACTLVLVALGIIGVGGVFYAARSVSLQYKQYEEDRFSREQGSINLAWRTLADADGKPNEIGQSGAMKFLINKGALTGNIKLNGSQFYVDQYESDRGLFIDLYKSSFCGTSIRMHTTPV